MNKKNAMIASIILNVMLLALVFMVKSHYKQSGADYGNNAKREATYLVGQIKDNYDNNKLLWYLIDSTWKSPDKSKAFVKRLADSQKMPRCGGKACVAADNSRLITQINKDNITVGWGSKGTDGGIKYKFKVLYDAKDKFVAIDASDLLDKALPDTVEEAGSESSGE